MSLEIRCSDRRRYMNELQAREKEIAAGLLKASQPSSPKGVQENEKRMRREIANSNERRRMQCINAGFSNLRALIPQLEGEKLSKAAILQHTTEYIANIEKEKARLQAQLDHTRRLLSELGQDRVLAEPYLSTSPPPSKRKKRDTESSDEGVGMMSDASDEGGADLQQENVSLRHQLESQKQQCAELEDRNRLLEAQLLSLLQVKASHSSSNLNELQPVKLESRHLQHTNIYSRELAVISSRDSFGPSPADEYQPPRPMSPTPERSMSVDTASRVDNSSPGYFLVSSPHCTVAKTEEPISFAMKVEAALSDTNSKGSSPTSYPSAIVSALTSASTDQHSYNHHHNYCHRDHPRRRHRQQAQMDQLRAEEELRRQQEQHAPAPVAYKPKHNTQNLENLVEAIRQIEGDRLLCDDQKLYNDKRNSDSQGQLMAHSAESERETSSMSDQEELKSESSGQDSPIHHHDFPVQHHQQLAASLVNHQQISPAATGSSQAASSSSSSINNVRSSSSSEKYPIATHLLHSPLHQSYYRPGVIVHKQ